jgi:lambda family phage portal protein
MKMNLLDKAIAWANPRAAYRRLQYRAALGVAARNWDGGSSARPNENWTPVNQGPEETDSGYRDRLRSRSRDLERNNELANSALKALRRNVVGKGIRPQAQVKKADGTLDENVNEQLEKLWKQWVLSCDIEGQSTFYELQRMILQRRVVDGEIFVIPAYEKRGSEIPLKLQLIEADYLNPVASAAGRNWIKSGVEVDPHGRPLAYHFLQGDSGQGYMGSPYSKRIEARNVWHLFLKFRPLQVRGMSEFAPTIMRLKDMDEYMNAELVAARIAACFAGFVKSSSPGLRVSRMNTNSNGDRVEDIEPGTINYLRDDEEISFSNPGRPNTSAVDFIKMQSRMAAAGNGMSYELAARDLSEVTYSSARQGHLEDRRGLSLRSSTLWTISISRHGTCWWSGPSTRGC